MFKRQQNVMKNRWCYSGSAEEPYALIGLVRDCGGGIAHGKLPRINVLWFKGGWAIKRVKLTPSGAAYPGCYLPGPEADREFRICRSSRDATMD